MQDYRAPIEDMRFVLTELAGLDRISTLAGYEDATPDLVDAILEEAAKLAGNVLSPINQSGDLQKARFENGVVRTPDGFAGAYRQFVDGGWNALPFDPEYGGQGLPWLVAAPLTEMWNSANMAFALCPLLTQGAVELLQTHGSKSQKDQYLAKLIAGEWTGTMNLTEPQAGTDVGAVKTRAQPEGDHYRITGQKIYITYGEHDFTDNIIHMVLARTPGAPAGPKGISLFVVPKFLLDENGKPAKHNDLRCVSIEHKLGINGSPTCVMAYGDHEGAIGYLIGEENRGLEYMFTMMNNARLTVGIQGIAIAERAYQQARAFAFERVQSKEIDKPGGGAAAIIKHPDVRRMLASMKCQVEAARALAYRASAELDLAKRAPEESARQGHQVDGIDLLTPLVKAWSTDLGVEIASTGVQVHGGMGFIEETGAAQHYRDARITPIYEGTNGIQALDLVGRKILRYQGETARRFCARVIDEVAALKGSENVTATARSVGEATKILEQATDWLVETGSRDLRKAAASATPYLRLFATVAGGWQMAIAAARAESKLASSDGDPVFMAAKVKTAAFYADTVLPQCSGLMVSATKGADSTLAFTDEEL
ncbi:acyl-CoA dehydrogenase [Limibacillus sp. MBR-115]|jgi:alkylation response protein AidB-like acyl-CoA dehydrogenase|uniref:acyl-CoA dehydrogenase n=1 Tax=Limibacillus sp. MBR-115 TaxID=3156465 RepID=UPI00339B34BA